MRERIINAVDEWIENNDGKDIEIDFLIYMRDNALGRENAKSTEAILSAIGYEEERRADFQQTVLSQFRKNGTFFVGWCSKGLYLVASEQDAREAAEFYQNRIQSEQQNLDNLRSTMRNYGVET